MIGERKQKDQWANVPAIILGLAAWELAGHQTLGLLWWQRALIKIAAFAALYFPTFAIISRFRKPKASA